jgi:hypothetical protein
MSLNGFEWMEDPLQLTFEEQFPLEVMDSLVSLEDCSFKGIQPCSLSVTETKESLADCQRAGSPFGSPEPYTEEEEDWQEEFAKIAQSSENDREVPALNLDPNIEKELVEIPVKEFNIRTKALKLDSHVLQYLKLCRKRLKNRQAAIRSRSKKENETSFLRNRVDELTREKEKQNQIILALQKRLTELEKKTKSS